MFIKRFLIICSISAILAGCAGKKDWGTEYAGTTAAAPSQISAGMYYPQYDIYGEEPAAPISVAGARTVSVLLPLSGANSKIGKDISSAIEIAFIQKSNKNINVLFFNLTGSNLEKQQIIAKALSANPDIILGPIFADDVRMVRDAKPADLPVISFSSDASALGGGALTMALMPTQSIETIVREIKNDGGTGTVIIAPKSGSGGLMAGSAVFAANVYDLPVSGLFYYTPGNSESLKTASEKASMYAARTSANTRAREILSNILTNEELTPEQSISINAQLDKISKSDTTGGAPYDSILLLGDAADSKSIASYLRYYDISSRDAKIYGTALWDGTDLASDLTMSGSKFAALPAPSENFAKLYERVAGHTPSRLDSFGFDMANLAIGLFASGKPSPAYLLDPSGYNGIDGLFRLRPGGESERALQVMELNGSGSLRIARGAPKNFIIPIYNMAQKRVSVPSESPLVGPGINPLDYIVIPNQLRAKYKSKIYGANYTTPMAEKPVGAEIVILPEDDSEVLSSPEFQPVQLEQINKQLIDSVEVNG